MLLNIEIFSGILTVIFTFLIAIFTALVWMVYRKMIQPEVFAYLNITGNKELQGLRVENAGKGVAWEGTIKCISLPSGKELSSPYGFKRLYPHTIADYPNGREWSPLSKIIELSKDDKLLVEIEYYDYDIKGHEKLQGFWRKVGNKFRASWNPYKWKGGNSYKWKGELGLGGIKKVR